MYLYFAVSQGETGKMSASDPISAIYVIDSAKDIKNKVCFQHIAVILFISKKKKIAEMLSHDRCNSFRL